jgi:hypothetical protein
MFDPKRAARVGAKKLRQRQDYRLAKRQVRMYKEECDAEQLENDYDREHDSDSDTQDLVLNIRALSNRKRYVDE